MNKKTSSIDIIAKTCIAVRMRMLNRLVTNVYDEALRPLGLKVSQMNILSPPQKWSWLVQPMSASICNSMCPHSAETWNG